MNEKGQFIATLLDVSPKSYAANSVLGAMEADERLSSAVTEFGFDRMVARMQERIRHLGEALACGRVEVFQRDLEWVVGKECAPDTPPALLRAGLVELCTVLERDLPAGMREMAVEYVRRGVAFLDGEPLPELPAAPTNASLEDLRRNYQGALLAGERRRAESIVLVAERQGVSAEELLSFVIGRAQTDIGKLWRDGSVSVAQEHFATRVSEDLVARLRAEPNPVEPVVGRVVLAAVAGNQHDLGLRILANHFDRAGWEALFLGADTPKEDLISSLRDYAPDVIALTIALFGNLRSAADVIAALKRAFPDLPVLVGGAALAQVEGLWADLGADGFAPNGKEAVVWARRQVTV